MATLSESFYRFGPALFALSLPSSAFWPYFCGAITFSLGLLVLAKEYPRRPHGTDRLVLLGAPFFAVAMAIFGADHLIAAKFVAMLVPSWMPGRLFWAYFVGFALLAAALSLATRIKSRLAAALLGSMILLFVLMIHLPNWLRAPRLNIPLTILVRDMALSAGALAFAASTTARNHGKSGPRNLDALAPRLIGVARFVIALTLIVFGIDQFLNPTFAPGIPQENPTLFVTMPAWIPAHAIWGRLTATIFLACAVGLMTRKYARVAAKALGITVMVLILFVYIPLTITKGANIADGLNYLAIHFALAGSAFFLASAVTVSVSSTTEGVRESSVVAETMRQAV